MTRTPAYLIALLLVAVTMSAALPAWAQTEGEARLGGGSDLSSDATVRLPQGGSIPAVHRIYADNPGADPIQVEFRAETATGIVIDPEWDTATIPADGSVVNHFAVEVAPSVAPGKYSVVIQLVRSDIESEPGRVTNIPAIQAAFTVEVVGDAAVVMVRSVSAQSGEPVEGTITLSARLDDRSWFEIDRAQGDTLDARVAPGEYRAAVLLGEREVAAEEFTLEADQTLDLVIEVETVSFVVAAVRPVTERGKLVVVELVASVNNETDAVPGPNRLQAIVVHDGAEVDAVTLKELSQVPAGISETTVTYRPDGGWKEGTYRFVFTLVTPTFTLTAADQPSLEVPAAGFDLLAFLSALGTRALIALVAFAVLALVLVERLFRWTLGRRRRSGMELTRRVRRVARAENRRLPSSRMRGHPSPTEAKASRLEERIRPDTVGRSPWDDDDLDNASSHAPPSEYAVPDLEPSQPIASSEKASVPSGGSRPVIGVRTATSLPEGSQHRPLRLARPGGLLVPASGP